ncbi:MAG: hypothetical protein IH840_03045 [Candidatus Heimdallarchaeota archaeon]|nr:hypothetical protein [Candidatus Heimdallarchaeota archaeon]
MDQVQTNLFISLNVISFFVLVGTIIMGRLFLGVLVVLLLWFIFATPFDKLFTRIKEKKRAMDEHDQKRISELGGDRLGINLENGIQTMTTVNVFLLIFVPLMIALQWVMIVISSDDRTTDISSANFNHTRLPIAQTVYLILSSVLILIFTLELRQKKSTSRISLIITYLLTITVDAITVGFSLSDLDYTRSIIYLFHLLGLFWAVYNLSTNTGFIYLFEYPGLKFKTIKQEKNKLSLQDKAYKAKLDEWEIQKLESDTARMSTTEYIISALAFDKIGIRHVAHDTKMTENALTVLFAAIVIQIFATVRTNQLPIQFQDLIDQNVTVQSLLFVTLVIIAIGHGIFILMFNAFIDQLGGISDLKTFTRVYGTMTIWIVIAELVRAFADNLSEIFLVIALLAILYGVNSFCMLNRKTVLVAGILSYLVSFIVQIVLMRIALAWLII